MSEQLVPVAGGQVWADDSGGDGPVVMLLHPGVGDSRIWDPVLPRLVERFRVIRYDVRGFGRSPAPTAPFTFYGDFLSVIEDFGLDRFGLVGCSMGGGVAATFALEQPHRVDGLVLLCPGFPGFEWPANPESDAEMESRARAGDVPGMAREAARLWARSGPDEAVERQLLSASAGWLSGLEFHGEEPSIYERLDQLSVPTTLMVGDKDLPALIDSNEVAAQRIPGCELIRMPGVDHLPPLREPELVARTILERFGG